MHSTNPRIEYADFGALAEGVSRGLVSASTSVNAVLPLELLEMVRQRASILNGCHFCVAMHTVRMQHAGVSAERIAGLAAWRDAPCYSDRERVAFALADATTRLDAKGVADGVYQAASAHFSPTELCALVSAIAVINAWNRIAFTFQFSVESATPKSAA